jgi:hypothetical protein
MIIDGFVDLFYDYKFFVVLGRLERQNAGVKERFRWESNIRNIIHEVGYVDIDWIELAQERHSWRHL